MAQVINNLAVGTMVNDPGASYNWIIVDKDSSYATLFADRVVGTCSYGGPYSTTYYFNSDLRDYVNSTFYQSLSKTLQDVIVNTIVYTGTSTGSEFNYEKVYIPSYKEVNGTGNYPGENAIPYFNSNARRSGGPYWLRSIYGDNTACIIQNDGTNSFTNKSFTCGVRPIMKIPLDVMVSDSPLSGVYQFTWNTAPTISGSDTNLGQKTDPFTYDYTVNDVDSKDTLTIIEKANGITIRTNNNAVRNQKYTADLASIWKQLPVNTSITLTITVSDGTATATRTISFTRKEDKVITQFKKSSLTPESVQPKAVLIRVFRQLANGADFKVFACNNGLDDNPTWEDATDAVLAETEYEFTNKMKTAENYAVNVKVQVLKNNATSYSYVTAIGFKYR